MLIKQQALTSHLSQKLAAGYILFGQEYYLLSEAVKSLKYAWNALHNQEVDESILDINNSADWVLANELANSPSLFAKAILIDLRFEKKTLDAAAKDFLKLYSQKANSSCLLILQAPNLPLKQLQGFSNHNCLHLIQANPLDNSAMQAWISKKLQTLGLKYEQEIPGLIQQYTEGNLLASAQVIEKLELVAEPGSVLTTSIVRDQLVNQCDYQPFELSDACLSQNAAKVIQLLRHACHSKVEPTLILWLLAQDLRLLIRLNELTSQQAFNTACTQLKIWPQRARLYQNSLKKIPLNTLLQLLKFCKIMDERIKTSQSKQIWQGLEQIALSLCLAREVSHFE